jgi:hypothetical protein
MAPDWRKAAFIHMDKKNAALKELETLRQEHTNLKNQHDDLYIQSWLAVLAVWVWGMVCVFYALKINP